MFIQREMTPEEFLAFADQHPDKRFDFIDGEIVEEWRKPQQGRIQATFGAALGKYAEQHLNLTTYLTVLHVLDGEKFLPDVCVNVDSDADYLTTPPLFVVEIRSDSQTRESQRRKMRAYLQHGTKMGVLVLPGQTVQVLSGDDTLDGGAVLPGFKLPLNRVLP
jgi:Uma2 family endonuclease